MGHRILLIKDEVLVREVLGERLRELGFLVDEATTGEEGIEKFGGGDRYDCIVTDFCLPVATGVTVIASIRKKDLNVAAVIITAYCKEMVERLCEGLSVWAVKQDPMSADDLGTTINEAIKASNEALTEKVDRIINAFSNIQIELTASKARIPAIRTSISNVGMSPP
jgi:CheY-like chemotaxis protein